MKRTIALVLVLVLLATIALAAYRAIQTRPDLIQQAQERVGLIASGTGQDSPLAASGILEARAVAVSSELGGRITALHVAEGDEVTQGEPLLTLDDSLLRPGIAQVEAAVDAAQAQLDLLQAGARPEQIDLARAWLAQAEAAAIAAQQAWDDARLLRDTLQDLDVQVIEAETTVAKVSHQAIAARRLAEATDQQTALWGRVAEMLRQGVDVPLPTGGVLHVDNPAEREQANTQWNLSSQQAWEAWQTAYAAEDAAQAAQTALADLRRARTKPIAADAQVHQAEAAYYGAVAAIEQARAALAGLLDGARPQEIALAQQAVEQARAARAPLEVQLAKMKIGAPSAGLVTTVAVRQSEVAIPGATLLEIADLTEVTLVVYVPQEALGRVWLGQAANVAVDSHPGRVFPGVVTRIADQAEFSLRGLQTEEARASAVFAVEISLSNPDGALKPGMPADVSFGTDFLPSDPCPLCNP
ncbi:MAG TPA: efflux RND transporter periplasmic adaptor subunit [Anaerolineae bacterium]|nr:efflux RND transporter periplasmic adaptor subunit [Anaerolineae bacterium]